jgi:3-oxoacyl-[acyl-carrier protein] reductase
VAGGAVTLAGQVVLVTGGSRGIGRACVLRAAALGAQVVFCSRSGGGEMRAVEQEAAAHGDPGSAWGVTADVSRESDVLHLFEAARGRFGTVDAVVHNAAISRESLLVSTAAADFDAVFATNLTGSFLIARQAVRAFLEQDRGGSIVFIGTLSQNGAPGNASYAASKGGVAGLMRTISRGYSDRSIRSNLVVTGYVETALSASLSRSARRALVEGCPLRRSASAEEIASVANFLLSGAARGVEGQAVFATGGLLDVPL